MELAPSGPPSRSAAAGASVSVGRGGALLGRLKEWRRKRAQADGVPGVGPAKLERYPDEVLAIVEAG